MKETNHGYKDEGNKTSLPGGAVMSGRQDLYCELLTDLHYVLLMMPVMPVIYLWHPDRLPVFVSRLFFGGFILCLPVVLSRLIAKKFRSLWVNLLADSAVWLCTGIAASALGARLFPGNMKTAYLGGILALSLLPIFSTLGRRTQEQERLRAKKEHDLSWRERPSLFREPRFSLAFWFVIMYLAGLIMACPRMCDLMLGCAFAYLAVAVFYRQIHETGHYLEELRHVSRIPEKRIRRVGLAGAGLFVILLLVLWAASSRTGTFRRYMDIRDWHVDLTYEFEDLSEPPLQVPSEDLMMNELFELMTREYGPPPVWLNALVYVIFGIFVFIGLRFSLRGLRLYAQRFREGYAENEDRIVSIKKDAPVTEAVSARRLPVILTEREKVRRQYRREIRKHRRDQPLPSETPAEIEQAAGINDEQLHQRYEKARYSS